MVNGEKPQSKVLSVSRDSFLQHLEHYDPHSTSFHSPQKQLAHQVQKP
jgi:hypothetical protein